MKFVALDATKLMILMVAGGAFALAGLWLMFRPKPEGGAAKLELFGAKFEASSAGLLVFLIGAGFLGVPLIVPERISEATAVVPRETGSAESKDADKPSARGKSAVILPETAEAKESEPNDFLTEANQITRSIFYAGTTLGSGDDTEDWFVVPGSVIPDGEIEIQIRARGGSCYSSIYDNREQKLVSSSVYAVDSGYLTTADSADPFYLRVSGPCRYELRVN